MTEAKIEPCMHAKYSAQIGLTSIEESGKYVVSLQVTCDGCKKPFVFVGLPAGMDLYGTACSLDGTELRAAVSIAGTVTNPFQQIVHGVHKIH
jgi:hypothetical protein